MKYEKWNVGAPDPKAVRALRNAGFSRLLSVVLAARGFATGEAARAALRRDAFFSPLLMRDMDKAVARIQRAIDAHETVAVFGDYDVDGITSTVLLTDYLTGRGVSCLRHIPHRIEEGYGLSKDAIAALRERGAELLITVDCGITGTEEVEYAASLGLDVVVTDHHACKEQLPPAVAVVDTHRPDCPYPFKDLAGCGVALKLVMALGQAEEQEALFARYGALAALGTVADVMRMEGENRTIVFRGLESLPRTEFAGLRALLKESGLWGSPVTSQHAGFILAPRLNAAGRMGQADLAADLLESRDSARAEELAKQLGALNRKRKAVEQAIFTDAEAKIQHLAPEEKYALVLGSEQWHPGVIGIVASRLSEQYACPCFMIRFKDGMGKGSCRSWGGLNLLTVLEECAGLLEGYGGHTMAAGFSIREENVPAFRERMNACVQRLSGQKAPVSMLALDAPLPSGPVSLEEVGALAALEPYGPGNPCPSFALLDAEVERMWLLKEGRHWKLRLRKDNARFDAIFFSVPALSSEPPIQSGIRVDAAFSVERNTYQGVTSVQLRLLDIRPSRIPDREEAAALSLIERVIQGEAVTREEAVRLSPSQEAFAACWRALRQSLPGDGVLSDIPSLPLRRRLGWKVGGENGFLHACMALEVFRERGLLDMREEGEAFRLRPRPTEGKIVLEDCPYLRRLRAAE